MILSEMRGAPRKPLNVTAIVQIEGQAEVLRTRSVDISASGMCIASPSQVGVGRHCKVAFSLFVQGQPELLQTEACIVHSVLSSVHGFRTGLRFIALSARAVSVLEQFVGR